MPDLTVSLVNWNTRALLEKCIQSVLDSVESITVEIIVIDNASEDGSVDMVRSQFPQVQLIANDDNVGFTRANNQSIAIATGRHYILLNSDTYVLPGALDRMVQYLDEHPDAGAVSARTWLDDDQTLELASLPPLGPIAIFCASSDLFRRWTPLGQFHRTNREIWRGEDDVDVDAIVGACFMVRRAVLHEIGPLDEGMFMYFEDADWSQRIRHLGLRLVVVKDAHIIHYHDKSGSNNPRKHQIFEASMTHWFRRIYGLPGLAVFGAAMKVKAPIDRIFRAIKRRTFPAPEATPMSTTAPALHWPKIPGAHSYLVEIGLDPAFAALAGRYVTTNALDLAPLATPDTLGTYFHWRIFGLRADGSMITGPSGSFTPVHP